MAGLLIQTNTSRLLATLSITVAVPTGIGIFAIAHRLLVDSSSCFDRSVALVVRVENAPTARLSAGRNVCRGARGEKVDRLEREHVDLGRHHREIFYPGLVESAILRVEKTSTHIMRQAEAVPNNDTTFTYQRVARIGGNPTYSSASTLSPLSTQDRMPFAPPLL